MKTISILHPFTPKAAGVVEKSVAIYHSQPHAKAMLALALEKGYKCSMDYFTSRLLKYRTSTSDLGYNFFPVDFKLNGNHKKWKKQTSKSCLKAYQKETPDVTIINMSGHSSPFSYQLSKLIKNAGKQYIAMLGGRHYHESDWLKEYYQNAHHILVHTELQKQEMQDVDMFKELDIRVFPLGVDTNLFKPKNQIKNQSIQLLYVGRISKLKRVHLAIETVSQIVDKGFKDIQLKIVGPIHSEHYQKELEKLVVEKRLESHVFFEGLKKHAELLDYFQNADLLLLPSESESFGMVVVESMACGVPVAVIEGVVGPEEIITNNSDGLITSIENYASEIKSLIFDTKRLNSMKEKARQKVITQYSLEETTQVLSNSINDALKAK